MTTEHVVEIAVSHATVAHHEATVHDRVMGADGPATQPTFDGVGQGTSELRTGELPHGHVAHRTDTQFADLAFATETASTPACRHVECHPSRAGARTVAQLGQQHRLTRFEPQRCRIGRRRTVDAEAHLHTSGAQRHDRRDTGRENQVAARAVGHTDTRGSESLHFVRVGHHAVRDPGAIGAPAGALEILHRATTERCDGEVVVFGVLGEVRVQAHVELLGQFGRANHQLFGHAERRARCEGHANHRPVRAIVVTPHCLFARSQDLVVIGDHIVGRKTAVLFGQRHRPAGRMETNAEFARSRDLGREQITRTAWVEVQVIGAGGAARHREFGQSDERTHVHRLFVDGPPQRIQRLQPAEQRLVGHRREGPREVLVDVVMGVDETRRDETVGRVDDLGRFGHRVDRTADSRDEPIGDGHPTTGQLAALIVHGGDEESVLQQEVGTSSHGVVSNESRMSVMSPMVVRGFTMQKRNTVSPFHDEGTTNDWPVFN